MPYCISYTFILNYIDNSSLNHNVIILIIQYTGNSETQKLFPRNHVKIAPKRVFFSREKSVTQQVPKTETSSLTESLYKRKRFLSKKYVCQRDFFLQKIKFPSQKQVSVRVLSEKHISV